MRYQITIDLLIKQSVEWFKQEAYETVSEHITVLVNALSTKCPNQSSAKAFINVLKLTIDKLIESKVVLRLQALSWIDKTLRLAYSHGLREEQEQLAEIQKKLCFQLEEDKSQGHSTGLLQDQSQTHTKAQYHQYESNFKKMLKLLQGKTLSLLELTELVKSLKNIISNHCLDSQYAEAESLIEQTLLLCQSNELHAETSELIILKDYVNKKQDKEQLSIELEIAALEILNTYVILTNDDLLDKLARQSLALAVNQATNNTELQSSTLELMAEIAKQFSMNQRIDLAYQCLEQAIILAEELNHSEQRCRLNLAQGDLFARKQPNAPEFTEVVESFKRYFESYLHSQPHTFAAKEIETKISQLEIRVLYHESKPWIIQRLLKSSDRVDNFKRTFDEVNNQIGHRLIAYHETDLAWRFYADIQALLNQTTQDCHEEILVKLADISNSKFNPQTLDLKKYPQINDWQSYRTQLMQLRQALAKKDKPFREQQRYYTKLIGRMIAGWFKDSEALLGPAPDRYTLMGVGSMSRLTLSPFSDLECAFFVGNSESARWDDSQSPKAKYFKTLYRLLELRILSLGELRGFRLDKEGHAGVDIRLRGTPEEVLCKNHHGTQGVDNEMVYSILSPIFLYGDLDLKKEFHELLKKRLEEPVSEKDDRLWKTFLAQTYLPSHIKYFAVHDPSVPRQEVSINIKKEYISPIMYASFDLYLYYRSNINDFMSFSNISDFMKNLMDLRKIAPYFAKAILQATLLADEIRVGLHLHYGEQNDEALPYGYQSKEKISLSQKQQQTLELINWGLLKPLRFALESLYQCKGKIAEEDNFLFNPPQAMVKKALQTQDQQSLNAAVKAILSALVLADAAIDDYHLAYLELPENARLIFQQQLNSLIAFLPIETIHSIQQTCLDCPLPDGLRENQQEKAENYNRILQNLIATETKKPLGDIIKIKWITTEGKLHEGYLHQAVVHYLTSKGYIKNGKLQITTEKIAETDGRHLLIPLDLEINGQVIKLHLKIFPEMPGIECAVAKLVDSLCGFGTPNTQIACLEINDEKIPILLSQTIEGKPLNSLIRELGDQLNQTLNPKLIQKRVLLSILLNQEDNKPSNFIELICVDNDRSFFPAIAYEDGHLVPIVKDIIFCFDMMEQKIDPVLASEILHFDASKLLNRWLDQLEKMSKAIDQLFTIAEMEKFFPKTGTANLSQQFIKQVNTQHAAKETILPLTLKQHTLANLYEKIIRLQSYLKEHPHPTLFELHACVEPYSANYYRNLRQTFPSLLERFENGFAKLYGDKKEKSGAHQTKKTTLATLHTLYGKPQDLKTVMNAKNSSLTMARRELQLIHQRQNDWNNIYLAIMKGSPEGCKAFLDLPDRQLREKIINKIDFQKLSESQEQLLFKTLMQTTTAFRSLKLNNCNISDEILNKLLKDSPELKILEINNCPLVTERTVINVAKNCPILETLQLTRLNFKAIETFSLPVPSLFIPKGGRSPVVFAELRSLDLSENTELYKLYIEAPELLVLKANNAYQLKTGKCCSPKLQRLELSNCKSLTASELKAFITSFPYLKTANLIGCDKIEKRDYYMKFPYLLCINLDLVTDNYLKQLTDLLETFHNRAKDKKEIDRLLTILNNYFDAIERKLPVLIKQLSDPNPYVQQEAALDIKDLGRNDSEIIDPLTEQLSSPLPAKRVAANIALAHLKKNYVNNFDLLTQVFILNDKFLFHAAIPLLNQFIITEEACIEILKNSTEVKQLETLCYVFAHWTTYSADISIALKQFILTNHKTNQQAAWALYAYWQLEMKQVKVNLLWDWLEETKFIQLLGLISEFNPAAAFTIRKYSNKLVIKTSQEIDRLIQQIGSTSKAQNEAVNTWNERRIKIIREIGKEQLQDKKLINCFLELLKTDVYPSVRATIIDALYQMQLKTTAIDNALIKALNNKESQIIHSAINAIAPHSLMQEKVRNKLLDLALNDEHPNIRESALSALEKVNEYYPELLNASALCLNNPNDLANNKKAAIKLFIKQASLTVLAGTLNNALKPTPTQFIRTEKPNKFNENLIKSTSFLENATRRKQNTEPTLVSEKPMPGQGRGAVFFKPQLNRGSQQSFHQEQKTDNDSNITLSRTNSTPF
jgi:hypothetical protein